eukprot:6188792-Pleurochrysis_carterae.AAC.2
MRARIGRRCDARGTRDAAMRVSPSAWPPHTIRSRFASRLLCAIHLRSRLRFCRSWHARDIMRECAKTVVAMLFGRNSCSHALADIRTCASDASFVETSSLSLAITSTSCKVKRRSKFQQASLEKS